MTVRLAEIAKADKHAKDLPEDAKALFVDAYNHDFAWRCSEAHALKAAWREVRAKYVQDADGAWQPR